jgi:hypothetical protein
MLTDTLFPKKKLGLLKHIKCPSTNGGFETPYTISCYPLTASNKEDVAIKNDGEHLNTVMDIYSTELEGNCVQNELIHSCLSNSRPSYCLTWSPLTMQI